MVLGPILVAGGVATLAINYFTQKPNQNTTEVPVEIFDRTPHYTQLFENIGLMSTEKGDWIKCYEVVRRKNYRLVKFKLSDTLSCNVFKKATELLEEKMLVDYERENYKNKLQIYMDKGYMYFRVLNEKIDLIPYEFKKTPKHLIPIGTDLDDVVINWNLKKDPHIKVIGASGSGKSREQNIIINHVYWNIPGAPMWFMDFKIGIEFGLYENTKNCVAYAETLEDAPYVIQSVKDEYEKRIKIIKDAGFRDYNDYIDAHPNSSLKRGFVFADEFADLMDLNEKTTDKKKGFDAVKEITDLSRKLRATGIHIVLGTQRPTTDNMPSTMKANVTGTIGMKTENEHNSRLIIDEVGCELLRQSEAIGILESQKTHFRSFYIESSVMEATAKAFAKPTTPKESPNTEPTQKKKKNPIK